MDRVEMALFTMLNMQKYKIGTIGYWRYGKATSKAMQFFS